MNALLSGINAIIYRECTKWIKIWIVANHFPRYAPLHINVIESYDIVNLYIDV